MFDWQKWWHRRRHVQICYTHVVQLDISVWTVSTFTVWRLSCFHKISVWRVFKSSVWRDNDSGGFVVTRVFISWQLEEFAVSGEITFGRCFMLWRSQIPPYMNVALHFVPGLKFNGVAGLFSFQTQIWFPVRPAHTAAPVPSCASPVCYTHKLFLPDCLFSYICEVKTSSKLGFGYTGRFAMAHSPPKTWGASFSWPARQLAVNKNSLCSISCALCIISDQKLRCILTWWFVYFLCTHAKLLRSLCRQASRWYTVQ